MKIQTGKIDDEKKFHFHVAINFSFGISLPYTRAHTHTEMVGTLPHSQTMRSTWFHIIFSVRLRWFCYSFMEKDDGQWRRFLFIFFLMTSQPSKQAQISFRINLTKKKHSIGINFVLKKTCHHTKTLCQWININMNRHV